MAQKVYENESQLKAADQKDDWKKEEALFEFYNLEEPGLMLKFPYGGTKRIEKFTFLHGGKYKVRREIAAHVETRQTPIWSYRPNGIGQMEKQLTGWKPRFQMREVRG